MGAISSQENILFINRKSTPNAFFTALAERQDKRVETPVQRYHAQLKLLEKAADLGDFKDWQRLFPVVLDLAKAAGMKHSEDLEMRVHLKKMELNLLLNGQKRADLKAKNLKQQAAESQLTDKAADAKELFAKADKLEQLARQIEVQLLEKTA